MSRTQGFHVGLEEQLPALRAFARALARDHAQADDLVQETMLKAWINRDRFVEGTNLRAWLFTILRNSFYSAFRKTRREVADTDGEHARRLAAAPSQDHAMALRDFEAALATLPGDQREALVLVGAMGLSYEEAGAVCGAATGTIKSRVSRARARLCALLQVEDGQAFVADPRMHAALGGSGLAAAA
jgi:RNA polymerase sigma-70 factor (ECF subfamily)